jgi:SAM-dependent methyltransferase
MNPMQPSGITANLRLEYAVDEARLGQRLAALLVPINADTGLADYLAQAERGRLGPWSSRLRKLLGHLLSDFDANALLGAYPMHLLSTGQWLRLLGGRVGGRLLDVGAGSGDATASLAPLFDEVTTTEISEWSARALRRRGYPCHVGDVAMDGIPEPPYSAIACLNVLDRCPYPLTLLERAVGALIPDGYLIVALPLPSRPFYFDGPSTLAPQQRLACERESWEDGAQALVQSVLEPRGLHISALCRAPYLSGGDADQALYELDDVVVVCRSRHTPRDPTEPAGSE